MTYKIEIELTNSDILTACQKSIKQMFKGHSHFSICTVWECCELLRIEYVKETQVGKFLSLYHCVNFSEIEPEQIEKLKKICFGLVGLKTVKVKTQSEVLQDEIEKAIVNNLLGVTPEPEYGQYHEFEFVPSQF